MTKYTGVSTLSTLDANILASKALNYGLDKINVEIEKSLSAYNDQVDEIMSDFAQNVNGVQDMVLEVSDGGEMQELNELGEPVTKRDSRKLHVAFPLKRYGFAVGYTGAWLNRASVAEVNRKFMNAQIAHQKTLVGLASDAMMTSASSTVTDTWGNGNTITVQPFWNGNDTPPANSAGTKFAKSHTHYNAVAASGSPTNAEISALVNTVLEHDETEEVILVIHADNFAKVSALTDFTALTPIKLTNVISGTVDKETGTEDQSNRLCGYWKSMWPVYIKPYAVSGYVLCLNISSTLAKPLGYRQSSIATEKGLQKEVKSYADPMLVDQFISFDGFGVINRSAGAVLQLSATSYTDPTL
jgi:hypothetical protein